MDLPDAFQGTGVEPGRRHLSLLKRHLADFTAADLAHLAQVVKRKLNKIQYRPHLINGCLPPTGLITDHNPIRETRHHEFNLSSRSSRPRPR
jgi:hypothetical protein